MSNNRPWNPKGPRCTVRTKSSRKLSLTYQEELLFSKKKKEDKKRNKSKLKSKLTDEDIPDLADMLGEKLVKVVLVLFKVIFGLLPLDQAATLLEQTRLVFFFYKTFMTKQFSSQRREMFVLVSHHCRSNLHYKPAILLFFLFSCLFQFRR